jgi:CheY-like chemotaxis protein
VKILLSEDDPVMMMVLNRMLENLKYEVIKSKDGKEALEMINTRAPDLVITDAMLPIHSGFEIISFLKKLPGKKIPVILLSAMPMNAMKNKEGDCGADGYFMKPVSSEQLRSKIEELREAGNF